MRYIISAVVIAVLSYSTYLWMMSRTIPAPTPPEACPLAEFNSPAVTLGTEAPAPRRQSSSGPASASPQQPDCQSRRREKIIQTVDLFDPDRVCYKKNFSKLSVDDFWSSRIESIVYQKYIMMNYLKFIDDEMVCLIRNNYKNLCQTKFKNTLVQEIAFYIYRRASAYYEINEISKSFENRSTFGNNSQSGQRSTNQDTEYVSHVRNTMRLISTQNVEFMTLLEALLKDQIITVSELKSSIGSKLIHPDVEKLIQQVRPLRKVCG